MTTYLLAHEPAVRLAAFASIFVVMAAWEVLAPRRPQAIGRGARSPGLVAMEGVSTMMTPHGQ